MVSRSKKADSYLALNTFKCTTADKLIRGMRRITLCCLEELDNRFLALEL